jgi:hypothetical protein
VLQKNRKRKQTENKQNEAKNQSDTKKIEKLLNQENDTGQLKYMFKCIRTNPTLIGKECILRAKYVYDCISQ